MLEAIQTLDTQILLFIQDNVRGGVLNAVMVFFTYLGEKGFVWLVLGAAMLITKKHRRSGVYLIACIALCFLVGELIVKNLVARPRPFLTIPELTALVRRPTSWSFPSGHACASFACAFALTWRYKGRGAWFYILAVLIAVSRLHVGVHYPSDILAGALIGTAGSILICIVLRKLERKYLPEKGK